MPVHNSNALDDAPAFVRQESFGGGLNSYQRSSRIGDAQYARALNLLVDQSLRAQTRPGADSLGGAAPGAASMVQALAYYDIPTAEALLACVGNSFYKWDGTSWSAALTGYTAPAATNPEIAQGINELIIVDGTQNAYKWEPSGGFADLAVAAKASIVEWHTYRAFYAGFSDAQDTLMVSDVADPATVQDPQFVTRVGEGEGEKITAVKSLQGYWLTLFKENSIWMINADPTATQASQWAYSKVTGGVGCVGPRAAVRYGNDMFFLARDGIRTLRRMSAVDGQYEVAPPLSQPVQDVIDRINWSYADRAAAGTFDQFVFFALPLDAATEPSHTLVWNGRLGAWMGLWGWDASVFEVTRFGDVLQLIYGNAAGKVPAWKFDDDRALDATYQDDGAGYKTELLSKAWDFGDAISHKETWKAELRFIDSAAAATVELVLDGDPTASWTVSTEVGQNQLPVDLPFDLATTRPVKWRKGMGKKKFNEAQLCVKAQTGRLSLESLTFSAFLDTYR